MTETTDLTPPTKQKAPKAAKEPKPPKAPKTMAEFKGEEPAGAAPTEKKPRAPRTDYGFSPESTIAIVTDKEHSYRGKRLEWFKSLEEANGKTVAEWLESKKNSEDPPRGWLRFFVQDGTVRLDKPVVVEQEQEAA